MIIECYRWIRPGAKMVPVVHGGGAFLEATEVKAASGKGSDVGLTVTPRADRGPVSGPLGSRSCKGSMRPVPFEGFQAGMDKIVRALV
jgi:hypothetical protein